MELADILSEESVLVSADLSTKHDVLVATRRARRDDRPAIRSPKIYKALDDREQLGSTGLGNGIAVPHGKFAGAQKRHRRLHEARTPVDFDSVDDQPVDIVMMLLAPMGAGADHLKALAQGGAHAADRFGGRGAAARTISRPALYAILTAETVEGDGKAGLSVLRAQWTVTTPKLRSASQSSTASSLSATSSGEPSADTTIWNSSSVANSPSPPILPSVGRSIGRT